MKVVLVSSLLFATAGCGHDATSIPIAVPNCGVFSPTVSPTTATLRVGETVRVTGTVKPCEGLPRATRFRWQSSDVLTASVDSITGLVQARLPGTATIVGTLVVDPDLKGAMVVSVVR